MHQDTIDLVAFDESHLDGAVRLSRETGWPHRREDWQMLLSLSRGFVALQDGEIVGTTMVTPFGNAFATVNMVIVDAAMRGRGLGRRLMEAALQACGERECRLTATRDGLPLYEKLGFRATHEIRQHQGIPSSQPAEAAASGIDLAGPADFSGVAALDRRALGIDRRALLRLLADLGEIAVLREAGDIVGYAALRPFGRGEVIGPVVADTPERARALIAFLIASRPGAFLRIDTPEWQWLSPWLAGLGLAEAGGGIVMRRGPEQPAPAGPAKPFALASQALG